MEEKGGWTIAGRALPSESAATPPRKPRGATGSGPSSVAQPTAPPGPEAIATTGSINPLDRLLADRSTFSAEEEAEISRAMARHRVDRDHPVIQVVVEMLLYRRGFAEMVDNAIAATSATRELLEAIRAQPATPSPAIAPPPARSAKPSGSPSPAFIATIAAIVLAVALVAGVAGRAIGSVEQDAALRARSPQIATLLTTPPGAAALDLVRDNGNALPSILKRCRRFTDHGRPAEACSLWTEGTGAPIAPMTPLDYVQRAIVSFPAWPIVLLLIAAFGFRFAWRKGRSAAGKANRGW